MKGSVCTKLNGTKIKKGQNVEHCFQHYEQSCTSLNEIHEAELSKFAYQNKVKSF